MNIFYKIKKCHQLASGPSASQQPRKGHLPIRQGSSLVRAMCVAAAIFVAAGFGAFAHAGTPVSFLYNFASGIGTVTAAEDPIAYEISFSDLVLYNVSKGDVVPGGGAIFGPFPNNASENHFMSLTISAPSGYQLDVDRNSLGAPAPQAFASFRVSGPGTSETIEIRFGHNPAVSDFIPLGNMFGRLTLDPIAIPEPSTMALVGFGTAGLALRCLTRRFGAKSSRANS